MGWELVLVVSVYKRQFWTTGLQNDQRPDLEQPFTASLADVHDEQLVSIALRDVVRRCEKWMKSKAISLVTHVVVTVYSLEIDYHVAPSTN